MDAHQFPGSTFASLLTPTMLTSEHLSTIDPTSTFIKMEDLQNSALQSSPAPSSVASMASTATNTHNTTSTEGKAVKKRKSWGQVLPEPKTNLPPRKRAKTEDEKEQRRIERVKRNRLAAHNSRERKRQEVELLLNEKDKLEAVLKSTQDRMARMAAELNVYRKRHGSIPDMKFEATPPPEDFEAMLKSTTVCPRQTSFPSPESMMDSMDSPRDSSSQPATPAFSETNPTEADQTRYPAAILCDLQCRSASALNSTSASPTRQSTPPAFQLAMAFLILLNLQLYSMRILSTIFSTSASSLTPVKALASAWTPRRTSSTRPSSRTSRSRTPTAFATQLVLDPSICRQTQAQLSLATRLTLQRRFSTKLAQQSSGSAGRFVRVRDERRKQAKLARAGLLGRRKGTASSSSLEQDIKRRIAAWDGVSQQNFGNGNHGVGV